MIHMFNQVTRLWCHVFDNVPATNQIWQQQKTSLVNTVMEAHRTLQSCVFVTAILSIFRPLHVHHCTARVREAWSAAVSRSLHSWSILPALLVSHARKRRRLSGSSSSDIRQSKGAGLAFGRASRQKYAYDFFFWQTLIVISNIGDTYIWCFSL